MTKRRFIKLVMSEGCDKQYAEFAAKVAREQIGSYDGAYYDEWCTLVKGRFENYIYPKGKKYRHPDRYVSQYNHKYYK